jgi:hypothetical protein
MIDAFLDAQDVDIQSPRYGKKLNSLAINRPTQDWSRPLQDAGWRRWFDTLKKQGVTGLADASVGRKRGMFPGSITALDNEPLTGEMDPLWTARHNPLMRERKLRT